MAVREVADPVASVVEPLRASGHEPREVRTTRPTVEDAFVSMVREDEALRSASSGVAS